MIQQNQDRTNAAVKLSGIEQERQAKIARESFEQEGRCKRLEVFRDNSNGNMNN
jgi:hypothetical protein